MEIGKIAKQCGFELVNGDGTEEISGIAYAREAKVGQVAAASNRKEILQTKALAVLTLPRVALTDKVLLYIHEPLECAVVRVAECLVKEGECQDYSKIPSYQYNGRFYRAGNAEIGEGTEIGQNAVIGQGVIIGENCRIGPNAQVQCGVRIGKNARIGAGAIIGSDSFYQYGREGLQTFCGIGRVIIQEGVFVGANTVVQRGAFGDTVIGAYSQIGDLVNVGHDVKIGGFCKIVSQTGIASRAVIGDRVVIYGQVGIAGGVTVGDDVVVMGKSRVSKDIPRKRTVSGAYARDHGEELRIQAKIRKL